MMLVCVLVRVMCYFYTFPLHPAPTSILTLSPNPKKNPPRNGGFFYLTASMILVKT